MTCELGTRTQFPSVTDSLMIALGDSFFKSKILFLSIEEEKDKFSYFDDQFRYNSHGSHSNIQNKLDRHHWQKFQIILMQIELYCSLSNNQKRTIYSFKEHSSKISRDGKSLHGMIDLTVLNTILSY